MKSFGRVAVTGLALLQLAAASCCRSNQCLRAIVLPGVDGVADCSAKLVVTVTPSGGFVTATTTAVESVVTTALFTEIGTETASTETLLFTERTTITASTQTNPITEATTVPVTATVTQTAAAITTTTFQYQAGVATIKVRDAADVPAYAAAACPDWDAYVAACRCAGVVAWTVTAAAPAATTVTVPAADVSVVSTLSRTETSVVLVTATTSATVTDTDSLTATVTTTATDTVLSTATALQTTTPTVVVPVACKPTGISFRASNPFPDSSTRWMNVVNSAIIAWQTFPSSPSAASLGTSTWVLDSNGYLQLANSALVAYVSRTSTASSIQVQTKPPADVAAGIAAGAMLPIKACVNAATNRLTMMANGRSNMVSCGNALYLSLGTGTDVRSDCVQLTPAANTV